MEFVSTRGMLLLFAGETGNAEEVAYDIQEKLQAPCRTTSTSEYDIANLPSEHFVVFVVSSTGDGEPPEPMKAFWSFLLRKGLAADALSDMAFAIFGLGDSSYDKYNAVARKLEKRLCMLGAKGAITTGYGDDQAPFGYLSAYFPWLEDLKSYVLRNGIVKQPTGGSSAIQTYSANIAMNGPSPGQQQLTGDQSFIPVRVVENRRLTADVWPQDVRHIRMDVDPTFTPQGCALYTVGDVAVVPYENPVVLVELAGALIIEGCRIHTALELSLDTLLEVTRNTPVGTLPRPSRLPSLSGCTLRKLLTRHLDIGAVPKRSYFEKLAQYASDPEEADKLRELASAQGSDLYFDYCVRERKNYVEVLQEFRSCRPPLSVLLEVLPVIGPRKYSIASSPALHPRTVR
jgi:sulfite reductase alpha subunit-like flavoprotein